MSGNTCEITLAEYSIYQLLSKLRITKSTHANDKIRSQKELVREMTRDSHECEIGEGGR
jgi:hypothetical protein